MTHPEPRVPGPELKLETRDSGPGTGVKWRRIAWLEFWLCLLPPVGLWMLWRDTTLSRSAKGRMVLYTILVPTLVYLALSLYLFHLTERAIQAGGGVF